MDLDTLGVDEVAVCLRSITGRSFSVLKPQMGGHVISGPFILDKVLLESVFVLFQFVSCFIVAQLSHFYHSSVHEISIKNQSLISFLVLNMGYHKVVSPLFENNRGALGIAQLEVIIPKVFFNQLKTVSHLYFGAPKEILTHYPGLLLSEWE